MSEAFQNMEIIPMGKEGQIVIPASMIKNMKLTADTKFIATHTEDKIIITVLNMHNAKKELDEIIERIHSMNLNITEGEILDEIKEYRRERRLQ